MGPWSHGTLASVLSETDASEESEHRCPLRSLQLLCGGGTRCVVKGDQAGCDGGRASRFWDLILVYFED